MMAPTMPLKAKARPTAITACDRTKLAPDHAEEDCRLRTQAIDTKAKPKGNISRASTYFSRYMASRPQMHWGSATHNRTGPICRGRNPFTDHRYLGMLTTVASIEKRKKIKTIPSSRVLRLSKNLKFASGFGMRRWRTTVVNSRKTPETVKPTITPECHQ